jgi:beta-lactam-binding protein with PASTA domain
MLNALLDRFGLEPPERPTLVRWTLKLVGVWVVVLTASWFLLQWYSRRGDVISVPDVRGMEREAAVEALEEAGLEPMQLDSVYKDGAEPHHVADQVPPPGSQIKGGRLVYLTTYRALPPSESIGVKEGQDLAVARIILQNKGFRITEVAEPHTTLLNKVIRITDARGRTVSSGSRYPRGASLTVVYGSADGGRVQVPALLGLSYSAARDSLLLNRLALGLVSLSARATAAGGDTTNLRVTRFDVSSGTGSEVPAGTEVDLELGLPEEWTGTNDE